MFDGQYVNQPYLPPRTSQILFFGIWVLTVLDVQDWSTYSFYVIIGIMVFIVQDWIPHGSCCSGLEPIRFLLFRIGAFTVFIVQDWSLHDFYCSGLEPSRFLMFRIGAFTVFIVQDWSLHGFYCSGLEPVRPVLATVAAAEERCIDKELNCALMFNCHLTDNWFNFQKSL